MFLVKEGIGWITRWPYCVECPQYSIRLEVLGYLCSVHKLFTSCIRRGLVSRDSIVDGNWLPATEWCHSNLPCCQSVAENLRMFLIGVYRPGEGLWIDSNSKNSTVYRQLYENVVLSRCQINSKTMVNLYADLVNVLTFWYFISVYFIYH